jgi:hypothetical protein
MMAEIIRALESAAIRWSDPQYPARAAAIESTLACENRFTLEAIAFAIDQQMAQVRESVLRDWIRGRRTGSERTVGVLNAGNVPLAGLQDLLAVLLTGNAYLGVTSSKSPYLLPAFVADCGSEITRRARFSSFDEMLVDASALIATGTDETRDEVRQRAIDAGISEADMLLRGNRFSIAVIDGREHDDDLDGLAEDILLHEGFGCRNVAIVFAPEESAPDGLLDAMARFRAVFPAHDRTPGALSMHRAMLAAVDAPHAYGVGLEFLVSKGVPEVQLPGHMRWSPYGALDEVATWAAENRSQLQVIVGRERLLSELLARGNCPKSIETAQPGETQRPAIDWRPDGIDTIEFLTRL